VIGAGFEPALQVCQFSEQYLAVSCVVNILTLTDSVIQSFHSYQRTF
jgi:hypothetical protein